ncbi:MAG: YdcH family protein [Alphaproteobacteria bacterium]
MSMEAHINAIAEKRAQLKELIALESARPAPDFTLITTLKKQNLTLKEEMQRYLILMKKESMSA